MLYQYRMLLETEQRYEYVKKNKKDNIRKNKRTQVKPNHSAKKRQGQKVE